MLSFVHAAAYSLESFREKAAANRVKTFSVGEWAKSIIMIAITHAKLLQVNRNVSKYVSSNYINFFSNLADCL